MTMREIACEAGVSLRTIARWRRSHGIPARFDTRKPMASGPSHHSWQGKTICPDCAGRKRHGAIRCRLCSDRAHAEAGVADVTILVRQWAAVHWRPAVFARDGYSCQTCGDSSGGNLEAHHKKHLSTIISDLREALAPDLTSAHGRYAFVQAIIASPVVRSLDNGITLCAICHREVHTARPRGGDAHHVAA